MAATSQKRALSFLKDESGATAIEYGLIAGLIAVVIIGALTTLGTKTDVDCDVSEGPPTAR